MMCMYKSSPCVNEDNISVAMSRNQFSKIMGCCWLEQSTIILKKNHLRIISWNQDWLFLLHVALEEDASTVSRTCYCKVPVLFFLFVYICTRVLLHKIDVTVLFCESKTQQPLQWVQKFYILFFYQRNYLEWMVDLPWSQETKDKLDISQAR